MASPLHHNARSGFELNQQSIHIPWAPHWVPLSVVGFTFPSLGDGLSTGPSALWMENSEIAAVVVVVCLFTKKLIWRELQIQTKSEHRNKGRTRTL